MKEELKEKLEILKENLIDAGYMVKDFMTRRTTYGGLPVLVFVLLAVFVVGSAAFAVTFTLNKTVPVQVTITAPGGGGGGGTTPPSVVDVYSDIDCTASLGSIAFSYQVGGSGTATVYVKSSEISSLDGVTLDDSGTSTGITITGVLGADNGTSRPITLTASGGTEGTYGTTSSDSELTLAAERLIIYVTPWVQPGRATCRRCKKYWDIPPSPPRCSTDTSRRRDCRANIVNIAPYVCLRICYNIKYIFISSGPGWRNWQTQRT